MEANRPGAEPRRRRQAGQCAPGAADGSPIIKLFTLQHVDSSRASETIRAYLTTPGGTVQPVQGQKVLIVTDYPAVVDRIEKILGMLDSDGSNIETRFLTLKHADAAQVVTTVTQLLSNQESARFGNTVSGIFLAPDERTNQIAVIAPSLRLAEVSALIEDLDKQIDLQTKVYRLKAIAPDRVDRLMKDLLGASAKRTYQSSIDHESQSLIIAATPEVLTRVDAVVKELDVATTEAQSPVRFYKLKNTRAADVLATISGLFADASNGNNSNSGGSRSESQAGSNSGMTGSGSGRSSLSPGAGGARSDVTTAGSALAGAMRTGSVGTDAGIGASSVTAGQGGSTTDFTRPNSDVAFTSGQGSPSRFGSSSSGLYPPDINGGPAISGVRASNATVNADANTNSIIVIAPPAVQQQYADLIRKLDIRRPQVQIECTIVTLNTSDGFSLAVDIGKFGAAGPNKLLSFSSFGVSAIDPWRA